MSDWTNANSANGPMLARWVRSQPTYGTLQAPHAADRVSQWSRGERPSFAAVDRTLTALGFHVSEVPEECWSEAHTANAACPSDLQHRIADAYKATGTLRAAAKLTGVSPKTVSKYVRQVAA